VKMPVDFLLFPMGVSDLVLGAQWLWMLLVKFNYQGKNRLWQVVIPESLQVIDELKMLELVQEKGRRFCCQDVHLFY